jgi:hypothetical protein
MDRMELLLLGIIVGLAILAIVALFGKRGADTLVQ